MFSIANVIAYDRLMVRAMQSKTSSICQLLGPSAWFDVKSESDGKWSAAEGALLQNRLLQLQSNGQPPDIYILSPFVTVAYELRKLIYHSHLLSTWNLADKRE